MSLTKALARTMIQQVIDDPNATLWSATNLDQLAELALDEMWSDILNYNPWFTSQLDTVLNLTSPGYLDLRLVADGGHLSKRFHRLQSIVRGGTTYSKYDPRDTVVELSKSLWAPDNSYIFLGDQIWLFPFDLTTDVEIRYSYKPTAFTVLTDATKVTWPEGHDTAYVYEIAARAMTKGDRESNDSILQMASKSWDRLLDFVRRRQIGPTVPWSVDSSVDFGGI
jgi:hypothetical protein